MQDQGRPVPIRTILVTIGLVVATFLTLYAIVLLAHIETLLIVAAFFAVVLTPAVDYFRRHLHLRRGLATTLVFLLGLGLISLMMYAFVRPLIDQTKHFAKNFPTYLKDAREGRGPAGDLVKRYKLDERYDKNKAKIEKSLQNIGGGAFDVSKKVFQGIVSLLTIMVLAFMMILYGPDMLKGGVGMLSPPNQRRASAVGADCARALTGYVMGNLLISIIAGTFTFIGLLIFGVPFRGVLALWVGFADLIPLVGATLGAIPTIGVAFLHSTTAGIGILVFYIVYQQFENHFLQVVIMSKTVQINQLFVLVSVLIGVELFGLLGALLAIPAAGVIQVIVRDFWDSHRGRPKHEPTIGADEHSVEETPPDETSAGGESNRDSPETPPARDNAEVASAAHAPAPAAEDG